MSSPSDRHANSIFKNISNFTNNITDTDAILLSKRRDREFIVNNIVFHIQLTSN